MKRILGMTVATMLVSFSAMTTAYATPNNDDAILMSVNGDKYSSEATTPVLMALEGKEQGSSSVIVPCDVLEGSLTVKNNGESHGTLKAYLVSNNDSPDVLKIDEWFNGEVMVSANGVSGPLISWAPVSQGGKAAPIECTDVMGVKILDEKIKKNKTVDIDLSLEFDADAVSGNSAGSEDYAAGERSSELTLYLTLVGDVQNGNNGNNKGNNGKSPGKEGNNGNPGNSGNGNKGNRGNGNSSGKSVMGSENDACNDGVAAPGKDEDEEDAPPTAVPFDNGPVEGKEKNPPVIAALGAAITENPFAAAGVIGILAIAIGSTILFFNKRKN